MSEQRLSQQVVGAMVAMLLLAGCVGPAGTPLPPIFTAGPPAAPATQAFPLATSIEDIVGTWHSGAVYLRFHEDGTMQWADTLDELDSQPYATGNIQFEGTQMTLKETAVSGVPSCGDALGIYEVQLLPDGKIKIVTIEEECAPRAGDTALEFEPVR